MNLVSRGHRIYYLPSIVTQHRASPLHRNKADYFRRSTRNHLLTLLRYFPFWRAAEFASKELLYQSLLARRQLAAVALGAIDFLRMAPQWLSLRRRIPPERQDYLRLVRSLRYPSPWRWYRQQLALRRYRNEAKTG